MVRAPWARYGDAGTAFLFPGIVSNVHSDYPRPGEAVMSMAHLNAAPRVTATVDNLRSHDVVLEELLGRPAESVETWSARLAWLDDLEPFGVAARSSEATLVLERATDESLAEYYPGPVWSQRGWQGRFV